MVVMGAMEQMGGTDETVVMESRVQEDQLAAIVIRAATKEK